MRDKASEESSWRNLSRPRRFRCVEPTRRDVTCGGALAAFSLLLTDLLGTGLALGKWRALLKERGAFHGQAAATVREGICGRSRSVGLR